SAHEHFLRQIGGVRIIVSHLEDRVEDPPMVLLKQLLECPDVALLRAAHPIGDRYIKRQVLTSWQEFRNKRPRPARSVPPFLKTVNSSTPLRRQRLDAKTRKSENAKKAARKRVERSTAPILFLRFLA